MVYLILSPKSIEHYFIKRVGQGQDRSVVGQAFARCRSLRPQSRQVVRVLLCEDGRPHGPTIATSVCKGIESLYALGDTQTTVEIVTFSFLAEPESMAKLLMDAELFYFAGGFDKQKIPAGLDDAMRNGHLLHLLRVRVQCNYMGFFGVCAGAQLAGNVNHFGLPGFDFLSGIKVQYDAGVAAALVTAATDAERQIVQMTSGCALAFVMDETMQKGICFTCVKNHAQWEQFASTTSEEVQKIIAVSSNSISSCNPSLRVAELWCRPQSRLTLSGGDVNGPQPRSLATAVAADAVSADPQSRANVQPGTLMRQSIPAAALPAEPRQFAEGSNATQLPLKPMEELSGQGLDDEVDELSASDCSSREGDTAGTLTEEDIARGDMAAIAARRYALAQPIRRFAGKEPAKKKGNWGERSGKGTGHSAANREAHDRQVMTQQYRPQSRHWEDHNGGGAKWWRWSDWDWDTHHNGGGARWWSWKDEQSWWG